MIKGVVDYLEHLLSDLSAALHAPIEQALRLLAAR